MKSLPRCRSVTMWLAVRWSVLACVAGVWLGANARPTCADGGLFETLFGVKSPSTSNSPTQPSNTTHVFKRGVVVRSADGRMSILSFCLNKDGQIIALVGSEMGYGGGQEIPTQSGVKVLSKEGEALKEWKVDFAG
jgi:hypothetical protein